MVCKNWRRSIAIAVLLPHQLNTTPKLYLFFSSVFFLRPPTTAVAAATSPPWMVCSVLATKGLLEFRHPFTGIPIQNMHLNELRFSEVAVAYHLSYKPNEDDRSFDKVLVSSAKPVPSIGECSVLALLRGGRLGGYPPFAHQLLYDDLLPWKDISFEQVDRFDDVVRFKGMLLALTRQGTLYSLHDNTLDVSNVCISDSMYSIKSIKRTKWRKRLVGTSEGKLYLVVRQNGCVKNTQRKAKQPLFKVYKLSGSGNIWDWAEVKGFDGRVLFMSRDYCFFTSANEFPGCQLSIPELAGYILIKSEVEGKKAWPYSSMFSSPLFFIEQNTVSFRRVYHMSLANQQKFV